MKLTVATLLLIAATVAHAQNNPVGLCKTVDDSMLITVAAVAAEDATTDAIDQDTLTRALYLCQWKLDHDVPDNAPDPAVCRSSVVSTDDAMLQLKQWWTFWARLDPVAALKANQQFSADYTGFRARLQLKPALAEQLLPRGITLQQGDWRVKLIRELVRRYSRPAPV